MHAFTFGNKSFWKSKMFYFIYIPLAVIFVLNLLTFILSSIFDLEIMDFFSNGLKSRFLTILSQIYHFAGYTELYIPFFIFLFFCLEYVCRYFSNDKFKIYKLRFIWFGLIIFIWVIMFFAKFLNQLLTPFSTKIIDRGGGDNYSVDFSLSYFISNTDFKFIILFIFLYQLVLLIVCLRILKIKILDHPDFIKMKYWINAIELLIFFIISYFMVGFLKVIMGRDYYKSINYVLDYRAQLYADSHNIDVNSIFIDYKNAEYSPWWKADGLIGNPGKIWDIFKNDITKIFTKNAFPSGHMAATGLVGYLMFSFIFKGSGNDKAINKKTILLFWIFNLHMAFMDLSFLINGSHWQTDLSFTWMWVIATILICQLIAIRLNNKYK